LNTHGGLLLYLGGMLGVTTWLAKGYFDSILRDLDEAATVLPHLPALPGGESDGRVGEGVAPGVAGFDW
jgi:hypothetical protein